MPILQLTRARAAAIPAGGSLCLCALRCGDDWATTAPTADELRIGVLQSTVALGKAMPERRYQIHQLYVT